MNSGMLKYALKKLITFEVEGRNEKKHDYFMYTRETRYSVVDTKVIRRA